MTVSEQIGNLIEGMMQQMPDQAKETFQNEVGKILEMNPGKDALKEGDNAIRFILNNDKGEKTSLDDLLNDGPVVLSFHRGNWCPFCNVSFKSWNDNLEEIEKMGAKFVIVSPQSVEKSAQLKSENGYEYPILSDIGNTIAEKYGLDYMLPETFRPMHDAFGMDIPAHNGDNTFKLPVPATYVIATDGKIVYSHVNPNWMERPEPTEVINTLKNLKEVNA